MFSRVYSLLESERLPNHMNAQVSSWLLLCLHGVTEHLRWQTSAAPQVGGVGASQPFPLAAASHGFWISEQFLYLHLTASITHLFTLDLSLLKSSLHFEQARGTLTPTPVILSVSWRQNPPWGSDATVAPPTEACTFFTHNLFFCQYQEGQESQIPMQDK